MNEYNERILKNILQDEREENDKELLREIEEAANNPMYQIGEDDAKNFVNKNYKKAKTKPSKILFRVASILLILAIGVTVIPIPVEGRKNTIAELIINYVNSEFFAVDNEDILLTFEGKYIPTWIPDGYDVNSITNTNGKNEIVFKNSDGYVITYMELTSEYKMNIDKTYTNNIKNIQINGYNAVYVEEESMKRIIITTEDIIQYINCDNKNIDLIGFAELMEKR